MNREKSIPQLQKELKQLKIKERDYVKLALKVKDLQEREQRANKSTEQTETLDESEQAQKLKNELQRTLGDIKKVQEDTKTIKMQTKSLQNQYRSLSEIFNGLVAENASRRQRIQLKDEKLLQKQNQMEVLVQKRKCNQLVVEQLKLQIAKLQAQEQQRKQELQKLKIMRQSQEAEKERLRTVATRVKQQLLDQETKQQNHRYKLTQAKQAVSIVKQQILSLLQLQQSLGKQLQKSMSEYTTAVNIQIQAQNRLRLMQDQMKMAEEGVRTLTDQYLRQGQELNKEELVNNRLNTQLDQISKQVLEVWSSLKQLMEVSPQKNQQLKHKAHQLWLQISQLMNLN